MAWLGPKVYRDPTLRHYWYCFLFFIWIRANDFPSTVGVCLGISCKRRRNRPPQGNETLLDLDPNCLHSIICWQPNSRRLAPIKILPKAFYFRPTPHRTSNCVTTIRISSKSPFSSVPQLTSSLWSIEQNMSIWRLDRTVGDGNWSPPTVCYIYKLAQYSCFMCHILSVGNCDSEKKSMVDSN